MKNLNREIRGITLIAVVITVIVLLILAGISINMISGENSILNRAGDARNKTQESQVEEKTKIAIMGSYDNDSKLNINKLLTNLNSIENLDVRTTEEGGIETFPVTVSKGNKTYQITSNGQLNKIEKEDRTGISIGDYIEYVSPTSYVDIEQNWTGITSTEKQTIHATNLFRVFEINPDGSMVLIGVMNKDDDVLAFKGSVGYNNAVYTLNQKCSELYKDTSKGITARSINGEDIEKKLSQSGKNRFASYRNDIINNLLNKEGLSENGVSVNKDDYTVTYNNIYTNCPDLFKYELDGKINGIATLGKIKPSQSNSEYNGLTSLTIISPKPTSITGKQTYVNTAMYQSYFINPLYYDMIFVDKVNYWVATRYIGCGDTMMGFMLGTVDGTWFSAWNLLISNNNNLTREKIVCPMVTIPSDAKVTISTNPKNQTNPDGTAHVVQ